MSAFYYKITCTLMWKTFTMRLKFSTFFFKSEIFNFDFLESWWNDFGSFSHIFCKNQFLFFFRVNFWGYSTVNYFSPMIRYSSAGIRNCGRDAINEVKFLIREAHKRGIEVICNSNIIQKFFMWYFVWSFLK